MKSPSPRPLADFQAQLAALSSALDHFRLDHALRQPLRDAAAALARSLTRLGKQDQGHVDLPEIMELSRRVWNAGYLAQPVSEEDLALATELNSAGWSGKLGAMLVAPCWQWAAAPVLDEVPDWLWSHFVDWVFVAPCQATACGAANAHLQKLESLAEGVYRWASHNLGSPCVKAAVDKFEANKQVSSPLRSTLSLKRWMTAKTGVFSRAVRADKAKAYAAPAYSREERPLRLGVFLRDWSESLTVRALLPRLSGLDPAHFSLLLFGERFRSDSLVNTLPQLPATFQVVPNGFGEGIEVLRSANLDVLIFAGDLSSRYEGQFALHRIAPLQIATDECPYATGLPEIDLHLTADCDQPEEFGEKLARLPLPGFVWDHDTARLEVEGTSRTSLGLPATGTVLVSATPVEHLSPETFRAWSAILTANPASTLLLLPPAGSDTFALEQIFHRLQADSGLGDHRFVVSVGDPRIALAHGDIYLDTYPYSAPTPLLAALAVGLPAVTWEGRTHRSRSGSRILRALGQSQLVAADEDAYVQSVQKLIRDAGWLGEVRESFRATIESRRGLGDALLESPHLGELIATAFDLLVDQRRLPPLVELPAPALSPIELAAAAEAAVARGDAPGAITHAHALLRSQPDSGSARSLLGRGYLLAEQPAQAVTCFTSALRGREQEAQCWLDIGAALRAQGDHALALTAYKAGLQLDHEAIEGWIAIGEMARAKGVDDLAAEAFGVARRLDAQHPRLAAINF